MIVKKGVCHLIYFTLLLLLFVIILRFEKNTNKGILFDFQGHMCDPVVLVAMEIDHLKTLDNFCRQADKVSEPLNNLFFHI